MKLTGCKIKVIIFKRDGRKRKYPRLVVTHEDIEHIPTTGSTTQLGLGERDYSPQELLSLLLKSVPLKIFGQNLVWRAEMTVAHYSPDGDGNNDFAVFAVRLVPTRGQLVTYETVPGPQIKRTRFYQDPNPTLVIEINNSFRFELLISKPEGRLLPLNLPAGPNWPTH